MSLSLLLHSYHSSACTSFEPMGEWMVPWHYKDFETEYHCLNHKAALIDLSHTAIIEVRGTDRTNFLQRLLSNDIARLQDGMGCRAFLLSPTGHIKVDFKVLCRSDCFWLFCDASIVDEALQKLEHYHFNEDVHLVNLERSYAVFSLWGPKAIEISGQLFKKLATIPAPYDHETLTFQDVPVVLLRNPLSLGVELLCIVPLTNAHIFWNEWLRLGAPFGLRPVGWHAYNSARIERGQPIHLVDFNEEHLLPETMLQSTGASETKGCYIGQEIVARMQTYGSANKRLLGVKLNTDSLPEKNAPLYKDGIEVGRISSASESPLLGQSLALAYIRRPHYEPGTVLSLDPGNKICAEVTALPFVSED